MLIGNNNYRYYDSLNYIYLYSTYPIIENNSAALLIYLLVYFIFNFLVFFIVNTFVEVVLVRKLHEELAEKKTRLEQMTGNSTNAPLSFRKKEEVGYRGQDRASCNLNGCDKCSAHLLFEAT
jgi:hypothetical protein